MKIKIIALLGITVTLVLLGGCRDLPSENSVTPLSTHTEPAAPDDTATLPPASLTADPTNTDQTQANTNTPPSLPSETATAIVTAYTLDVSQIVASGFNLPVSIAHAGDGSNRLFIVEQGGLIRIIENGNVLEPPFLDLSGLVSRASEQGLLGLAFHPEYEDNGVFFVDYTDTQGNTQIVRYRVSDQPNRADPQSAVNVFSIQQPYANHNGGQIAFGPDGYLYIALGDGGSANDPQNNAQDRSTPLGAILRIDVNPDGSYSVPDSNPFVGQEDADERIWAWGLRNPWRFSFDSMHGDLYIADVGQNQWEEIDFQAANSSGGLNYGWRCLEGTHANITQPPCDDPDYTSQFIPPIAEYSHSLGQSVTGGYVYRGSRVPFLDGIYFYGDFASGRIWSIRLMDRQNFTWSEPKMELESGINISSFGEGEDGEIYVADYYGGHIRILAATPQ